MSKKAEQVKTRYEKGYVRDDQLKRYLELGAITQEEYDEIYAIKHPTETDTETTEDTDTVDEATKDNTMEK